MKDKFGGSYSYDAGQQSNQRLTDAQLDTLERAARATVSTDERIAMLISGVLSLIPEVQDLRLQVEQLAGALEVAIQ